jgi:hypothetical protein
MQSSVRYYINVTRSHLPAFMLQRRTVTYDSTDWRYVQGYIDKAKTSE